MNFKYILTNQNPADLITTGLTFNKFKSNLDIWIKGLAWLKARPVLWPESELKCLSDTDKSAVQTVAHCSTEKD